MALNTINRVRDAELASSKKIEEASKKAESIIAEAKSQADEIIKNAVTKANALKEQKIAEASSESQALLNEKRKAYEKNGEALFQNALNKQQQVNELLKSMMI